MGNISSIHFKKSNAIQTKHNDRDMPPSYLVDGAFEVNRNHIEALKLRDEMIEIAKKNYKDCINQPFKAKTYEWSAVVNINENHTMQDLEKLAEHFLEKYGYQCYQIAIHRDEGHINDDGELKLNHHAHLEFITLDPYTGKNRQREIKPRVLRNIQTEVAEILGLERGIPKEISGTKRIEPRVYASLKERERRERKEKSQEQVLKHQERKEFFLSIRSMMMDKNREEKVFLKEDYIAIRGICHDSNYKNIDELRKACDEYLKKTRERELEKQKLAQIEQELAQKQQISSEVIPNLENEIKTLKTQNEAIYDEIQEKDTIIASQKQIIASIRAELDSKDKQIQTQKKENEGLKRENEGLKRHLDFLKTAFNNFKRRIRKWFNNHKDSKENQQNKDYPDYPNLYLLVSENHYNKDNKEAFKQELIKLVSNDDLTSKEVKMLYALTLTPEFPENYKEATKKILRNALENPNAEIESGLRPMIELQVGLSIDSDKLLQAYSYSQKLSASQRNNPVDRAIIEQIKKTKADFGIPNQEKTHSNPYNKDRGGSRSR